MLINAVVGLAVDADWFEQGELVGVEFRCVRSQTMKLTSNFGVIIRM